LPPPEEQPGDAAAHAVSLDGEAEFVERVGPGKPGSADAGVLNER